MNPAQENHIEVARKARYFQMGSIDESIKQVWFVCHGYGQLASFFIKQFEGLDNGHRIIIAPEALSRFYFAGVSGRIGAAWMTREDRLNEIGDYIRYLDAVYARIFSKLDRATVQLSVLGFSQGAATVCRWLAAGGGVADRVILWAGLLPPELYAEKKLGFFQNLDLHIVVGKNDEYASPDLLRNETKNLKTNKIRFQLHQFDGGHELDAQVLMKIASL